MNLTAEDCSKLLILIQEKRLQLYAANENGEMFEEIDELNNLYSKIGMQLTVNHMNRHIPALVKEELSPKQEKLEIHLIIENDTVSAKKVDKP